MKRAIAASGTIALALALSACAVEENGAVEEEATEASLLPETVEETLPEEQDEPAEEEVTEDETAEAEPTEEETSEDEPPAEEEQQPETDPEEPAEEGADIQAYDGPWLTPFPVPAAEENAGLDLETTDIGQHIVDDVNHERGVFDRGNWRVVTFCDTTDGESLQVGVIQDEEFAAISQAGLGRSIAENSYQFMLDCP